MASNTPDIGSTLRIGGVLAQTLLRAKSSASGGGVAGGFMGGNIKGNFMPDLPPASPSVPMDTFSSVGRSAYGSASAAARSLRMPPGMANQALSRGASAAQYLRPNSGVANQVMARGAGALRYGAADVPVDGPISDVGNLPWDQPPGDVVAPGAGAAAGSTGGIKGFFSNLTHSLPQMLKTNFLVSAVVSAVTNGLDLVQHKVTVKQAAAGFTSDTVAFTGIGVSASALGGAVGSLLGPIGTVGGLVIGSAVGMGLGWLYEKFVRPKTVAALSQVI